MVSVIETLYRIDNTVCSILLTIQIIVISIVVFGRFILNRSPAWGEEPSLFCMVWFSMLSISIGIRNKNHIRITLLEKILSPSAKRIVDLINDLMIVLFAIFIIYYGWNVVLLNMRRVSPAIGISLGTYGIGNYSTDETNTIETQKGFFFGNWH